jgi:hypothetical protein
MWDRVRRWALRISVAYLCLSVLAVGGVWWIGREGPTSTAMPSRPTGGGIVSLRPHSERSQPDRAVARLPLSEPRRPASSGEGLVRSQPADGPHGGLLPPAVSADRLRGGRPLPSPSETPSSPDRGRPARPGAEPHPPATGGPRTTTTGTTTPTTTPTTIPSTPSTGTTTPTTSTPTTTPSTGTAGATLPVERRSRR